MGYFLKQEYDYMPGFAFKGGGGSTGEVSYPEHMEDIHKDWLGYSGSPDAISVDMISVMDTALGTNPLDSLSYDDPATDITAIESEYDSWNTTVDALDEETDWETIVDAVVAKMDESGVLSATDVDSIATAIRTSAGSTISDAVESALDLLDDQVLFEAVQGYAHARRKQRAQLRRRYKANMANLSAERSSAYAIGLALLEIDFERETGQFQSQLSVDMFRQGLNSYMEAFRIEMSARIRAELTRDQFVMQGIQQVLQFKIQIIEFQKQLATILTEITRINFVMDSEYIANTADLNWKHSSWDMNVYANGIAVLGGLGGSQFVPEGPSKASSAIGGALQGAGSGALAGASIAAAGGPITALGGAAIGGLLGLGAGLFS